MPKSPTIAEIAKLAGVSKTTVSLILNHRDRERRVSEATVGKINAIIKDLNYHPSYAARTLSCGKTKCLGVICGSIFKSLFSAILDATDARGYRPVFLLTKWNLEKEVECVDLAISRMVDGVFLYGHTLSSSPDIRARLLQSSVPTIIMDGSESSGFPTVQNDFRAGMKEAFAELSANGHRKIALVHRPPLSRKLEPFLEQCEAFGMEPLELRFDGSDDDPEAIDAICRAIAKGRPDGIVVEDDRRCLRIAHRLSELGMRIPEALSAACVCTPDWFELSSPPIDIIAYDSVQTAELAIGSLAALIDGREIPQRQLARTYLIKRGGIVARKTKGSRQ